LMILWTVWLTGQ